MTLIMACACPAQVYAADAVTAFGSAAYTEETGGGEFPIGIYIRAEEAIGDYHLELCYDNARMEYVSGADSEEDGMLALDGTGTGNEVKVFLYFRAVGGGEAGIAFTSAEAYTADGREAFTITEFAYAPVSISGEDVTGVSFEEMLNGPGAVGTDQPDTGGTDADAGQASGTPDIAESASRSDHDTSSAADGAGRTETEHNISTAESIYEHSRQEAIENDRARMLWRFLYLVVFFMAAIVLAFIIVKIWNTIRSERQGSDGDPDGPERFLFEFETIPEEKEEGAWQQVRKDIDAREREGKNTQRLEFRRVNDQEYDLEVNELDYDMEVEYLDPGIKYADLETEQDPET
ncbi:MAG: hypothetical protein NC420_03095 [Eubacterium sp.]|nr:hypothetical protein [Eubacterium sp.]